MVQKPESDTEPKERRIDLSLPQVAGSAVAAVAAAVAASQLGVYGTIAGAGVMSVVATCGGSVFQHFFRRTGEQIREVTVQVKHPDREVTVRTRETGARRPEPTPQETVLLGAVDDATTALRRVEQRPDETMLLRRADPRPDETTLLRRVEPDATTVLRVPGAGTAPDGEFSEATTHGTRMRGWKRSAIGAAVVFVVSMAGITTYELISGGDLSGGHGTTVGSVVRGERHDGPSTPTPAETTRPGQDASDPAQRDQDTATPGTGGQDDDGTAPQPDRSGAPTEGATPSPTPSDPAGGGVEPTPTPTPSATDGGESAAPDPTATDGAPAPEDTGAGE
ncbi:hypothetical protein [Streptomyces drozdowiczii]|uniref:Uncharacterized protein n=1 Tax=Streptomyces drozdowiczii TaxID=202862 RepID=A0ABY6PQE9_9ACTN|nr:hypothetical protein [Streptomyces drozdowiczii]MCX0246540.1 hypothetical protein [Streptomyces drozdowiczii]UZK53971.1 hypothetical protein NEH16_07235 [Streptomyces drozdowiczii]